MSFSLILNTSTTSPLLALPCLVEVKLIKTHGADPLEGLKPLSEYWKRTVSKISALNK